MIQIWGFDILLGGGRGGRMGPIHQRKGCTCKVALVKLIFVGSDLINIFQRKYKIYVTMISKHSDWLEKIEQPIRVL